MGVWWVPEDGGPPLDMRPFIAEGRFTAPWPGRFHLGESPEIEADDTTTITLGPDDWSAVDL